MMRLVSVVVFALILGTAAPAKANYGCSKRSDMSWTLIGCMRLRSSAARARVIW